MEHHWYCNCRINHLLFILKQVNGSGSKDSNAYDTYTVRKETPISLEGKASPNL